MDILTSIFLGTPIWMWLTFITIVLVLLAVDLGLVNNGDQEIGVSKSLR